jgi:hypothetical protein
MASVSASPPFSVPARSSCRTASFFSPCSRSAIPRLYCEKPRRPSEPCGRFSAGGAALAGGAPGKRSRGNSTSSRISSGISPWIFLECPRASSGWPFWKWISRQAIGGVVGCTASPIWPRARLDRAAGAVVHAVAELEVADVELGVLDVYRVSRARAHRPGSAARLRVEALERLEPLLLVGVVERLRVQVLQIGSATARLGRSAARASAIVFRAVPSRLPAPDLDRRLAGAGQRDTDQFRSDVR